MSMLKRIEIDARTQDQWVKTRSVLTWSVPGFSHIFYTLLDNNNGKHVAYFTDEVPIAATDGSNVILNPATFFKYTLSERVFIISHEILHCVFDHPRIMNNFAKAGFIKYPDGVKLPFINEQFQKAADWHINDILVQTKVGTFNKDWLHDPYKGTKDESVLDIYRKNFHEQGGGGGQGRPRPGHQPGQGGSGQPQPSNGQTPEPNQPQAPGTFDKVLEPGVTFEGKNGKPDKAPERNDTQWHSTVSAAAKITRERGKNLGYAQQNLGDALARQLENINDPPITWDDKLDSAVVRKVGTGSMDWRTLDRRLLVRDIYSPGRSKFVAGDVFLAIDTSGSMTQREIATAGRVVRQVLEQIEPRRLAVIWCDAFVHRVDEVTDLQDLDDMQKRGAPGGGATDFRPVFKWIEDNCDSPDALIFFTDGDGRFPEAAPRYPVFWGNIQPGKSYPFGDVVDVPVQAYKK